jgi:PII-like signaling protein
LHEDNFFELAGDLPVQVEFILNDEQANQLLGLITAEGLNLPFVRYAVEAGTTGSK